MFFQFRILLFFTLNLLAQACTSDELVMVQFLFRHGSNAPAQLYPNDPNSPSIWREGLGHLTMFGKFQPFALGALLRAQYDGFITSAPTEVEIQSSADDASIKSTLSLVSALYAPTPMWQIVRELSWQPIAVKYLPENTDRYFGKKICPEAEREYEAILSSPEATNFLEKYQEIFQYWSIHSGWEINGWDSAARLYEVLETENEYNLTVPMWAKTYWDELQYMADMSFYWNLQTQTMRKLRGGPLVQLIIDNMKRKAGGADEQKKVLVYCTYDFNIAAFLSGLNLFNDKKPPFSATVITELYEHQREFYVRFLYLNSTSPEREPQIMHVLYLEGCSEFCPLDFVVDSTKDVVTEHWEDECTLKDVKIDS